MLINRMILLCIPLLLLLSCGGGAGDGGGNSPPDVNNNSVLNPDLVGKFFFQYYQSGAYTMDVKTGEYRLIPNTDWSTQSDQFDEANFKDYFALPVVHNDTEFILTAQGSSISHVAMQDYNGNYLGKINFIADVKSAALSQDLKYVALFKQFDDMWLEIYTWNGDLISDSILDQRPLVWLRDNRILYVGGRTIYFTYPASSEVEYRLTLPDGDLQEGNIGTVAVSPDESQIAFTIAESFDSLTNSRLYMSNIDGSNTRLVATNYNDDNPRLAYPQWSPDGRWLYVEEGLNIDPLVDVIPIIGDESLPDMYIIPTENMGKVFYLSTDNSRRSREVRQLWRKNTLPQEPGGMTNKALPIDNFTWIPD